MKQFSIEEYTDKANRVMAVELDSLVGDVYAIFIKAYLVNDHSTQLSHIILDNAAQEYTGVSIGLDNVTEIIQFTDEEMEIINKTNEKIQALKGITNTAYQQTVLFKCVASPRHTYDFGRQAVWEMSYHNFLLYKFRNEILPNFRCKVTATCDKAIIEGHKINYLRGLSIDWSKEALDSITMNKLGFLPFAGDFDPEERSSVIGDISLFIDSLAVLGLVETGLFIIVLLTQQSFLLWIPPIIYTALAAIIGYKSYKRFKKKINAWREV